MDQLSKTWIINNLNLFESREILSSFLKFSHVRNTGIAFGISIGEWGIFITILSLFATVFIGYILWQERFSHSLVVIGLSLVLGGAIGNLIDRSAIFLVSHYKGVVDFIDVGIGSVRWYTFNIADAAVTVGMILYLMHSLISSKSVVISND